MLWRRVDGVKTLRRTLVGLVPEVLVEVRVLRGTDTVTKPP